MDAVSDNKLFHKIYTFIFPRKRALDIDCYQNSICVQWAEVKIPLPAKSLLLLIVNWPRIHTGDLYYRLYAK